MIFHCCGEITWQQLIQPAHLLLTVRSGTFRPLLPPAIEEADLGSDYQQLQATPTSSAVIGSVTTGSSIEAVLDDKFTKRPLKRRL